MIDIVTSHAICWSLISNTTLSFTDSDLNIDFEGIIYHAKQCNKILTIENDISLFADKTEITGILHDQYINKYDILNRVYDQAVVEISQIYHNNGQGIKKYILKKGIISGIRIEDNIFTFEVKGLIERFNCDTINIFSQKCRTNFGSPQCKITPETVHTTIIKVVNNNQVIIKDELNNNFNQAILINDKGVINNISKIDKNKIMLTIPMLLRENDEVTIKNSCDKSFQTCCKFNNAINFRGEPTIKNKSILKL